MLGRTVRAAMLTVVTLAVLLALIVTALAGAAVIVYLLSPAGP